MVLWKTERRQVIYGKKESVPNVIKNNDIFARLITMSWLSRSSPAAAGELRDNQDIVIRRANMP